MSTACSIVIELKWSAQSSVYVTALKSTKLWLHAKKMSPVYMQDLLEYIWENRELDDDVDWDDDSYDGVVMTMTMTIQLTDIIAQTHPSMSVNVHYVMALKETNFLRWFLLFDFYLIERQTKFAVYKQYTHRYYILLVLILSGILVRI